MSNVVIPPSPNNYYPKCIACSPDNTLFYATVNNLIVLRRNSTNGFTEIIVKNHAHINKISSISCNNNWGKPHKRIVTCSLQNDIKIWNAELLEEEFCQQLSIKSLLIGCQFSADSRIVSVAEDGTVVLWKFNTNEPVDIFNCFPLNTFVNCMELCLHCSWLLAVGLRDGLVALVDLRKRIVLQKFRGDKSSVLALSWCPAPINIFPKIHRNTVKNRTEIKLVIESKLEVNENPSNQEIIETQQQIENEIKNSSPETVSGENDTNSVSNSNEQINMSSRSDSSSSSSSTKSKKSPKSIDLITHCNNLNKQIMKTIRNDLEKNLKKSSNSKINDFLNGTKPKENSNFPTEKNTTNLPEELIHNKFESNLTNLNTQPNNSALNFDGKTIDLIQNIKLEEKSQECKKGFNKLNSDNLIKEKTEILSILAQSNNIEQIMKLTCNIEKEFDDKNGFTDINENESSHKKIESSEHDKNSNNENVCSDTDSRSIISEEPEGIEEEPRNEYLLASITKDGKIYVWRAGTDSRLQTFWNLPKAINDKKRNTDIWYNLCWLAPDKLLSTSRSGDLFQWTLPKPKDPKNQFRIIHKKHRGTHLFNIVCAVKILTPYNWCDKNKLIVWTYGYNWTLCEVILDDNNIDVKSCSTTNGIASVIGSPVDPNRIILGLRDGSFKLWDLSVSKKEDFELSTIFTKSHNIITMACHPIQENIVAFGAEKGKAGYINLSNFKYTMFDYECDSPVYKVDWGPINGNKNNLGLYVTSDKKLFLFDITRIHDAPVVLPISNKYPIYRHSWKPNYDYLLVSTKEQLLQIFDINLKLITTLYLNEKLRNIVWHPNAISNQTDFCNIFAVATSDGFFTYDFNVLDQIEGNVPANKKNYYLQNYAEEVRSLSWNSLDLNKIACLTADGILQIWDINTKVVLSSFIIPSGQFVWDILWSPIDEFDIIIVGICVTIWKTNQDYSELVKEMLTARKKINKSTKTKIAVLDNDGTSKNHVKSSNVNTKKSSKKSILPPLSLNQHNQPSVMVNAMRKLLEKIENDNESNNRNCDISSYLDFESDQESSIQFFGSKNDMMDILEGHQKQWKNKQNYNNVDMLSVWKGDMNTNLKEAIDEKRVTPALISLAPMVSTQLWKKCCEVYAEQLMNDENYDPVEVAFYYIICHKLSNAVSILCENKKYREALALIKCRLPNDKENIFKITEQWAQQCVEDGNYEIAAECYISIQEYEKAAKILSRRKDSIILEFAADLALKANNSDLYDAIMAKSNEMKELEIKKQQESIMMKSEDNDTDLPTRFDAMMLKM